MKQIALRIGILIGLFISTSIIPWWAVFILSAISTLYIDNFFEVISIGLFYDIYYHIPGLVWYLVAINTLIMACIYAVSLLIQKLTQRPNFYDF